MPKFPGIMIPELATERCKDLAIWKDNPLPGGDRLKSVCQRQDSVEAEVGFVAGNG